MGGSDPAATPTPLDAETPAPTGQRPCRTEEDFAGEAPVKGDNRKAQHRGCAAQTLDSSPQGAQGVVCVDAWCGMYTCALGGSVRVCGVICVECISLCIVCECICGGGYRSVYV